MKSLAFSLLLTIGISAMAQESLPDLELYDIQG